MLILWKKLEEGLLIWCVLISFKDETLKIASVYQVLSLLAQFPAVEAVLVAPLGGNEEGRMILKDLENEGVITKYCKIWRDAGVPSAWVLHSGVYSTPSS